MLNAYVIIQPGHLCHSIGLQSLLTFQKHLVISRGVAYRAVHLRLWCRRRLARFAAF